MMQVTLPGGEMREKATHTVVNRSDRSRKYSLKATGTSLFLLPTLQSLAEEGKKTEHERLWAFRYWHILMQLCFYQSSRYYLHSEALCFFKGLCSRYECVVHRLWIMDEGVKGRARWEWVYSCMVCSMRPRTTRITAAVYFTCTSTHNWHTHRHVFSVISVPPRIVFTMS